MRVCQPRSIEPRDTQPGWRSVAQVHLHSSLEGPSFDRAGNLYCVDLAHGRVFPITPDRTWTVSAEYDGIPNGLKIHRDGRIFIADHRNGLHGFRSANRWAEAWPARPVTIIVAVGPGSSADAVARELCGSQSASLAFWFRSRTCWEAPG
jgi:hypothetical protein